MWKFPRILLRSLNFYLLWGKDSGSLSWGSVIFGLKSSIRVTRTPLQLFPSQVELPKESPFRCKQIGGESPFNCMAACLHVFDRLHFRTHCKEEAEEMVFTIASIGMWTSFSVYVFAICASTLVEILQMWRHRNIHTTCVTLMINAYTVDMLSILFCINSYRQNITRIDRNFPWCVIW